MKQAQKSPLEILHGVQKKQRIIAYRGSSYFLVRELVKNPFKCSTSLRKIWPPEMAAKLFLRLGKPQATHSREGSHDEMKWRRTLQATHSCEDCPDDMKWRRTHMTCQYVYILVDIATGTHFYTGCPRI